MSNLSKEEQVIQQIVAKFPFLDGKMTNPTARRIFVEPLYKEDFEKVLDWLATEGGFDTFHLVIGLDSGENLEFVYVLSNADKIVLNLKQYAPKSNPVINSVDKYYHNCAWHERELVDLFGAVVEGLPDGPHYPLPDNWPEGQYPMRKDWKVEYFDKVTMTYNPPAPEAKEETPEAPAEN